MERAEVAEMREEIERLREELSERHERREKLELDEKLYKRRVNNLKLSVTFTLMFMVVVSMVPVVYNLFRSDFVVNDSAETARAVLDEGFKESTSESLEKLKSTFAALRLDEHSTDPIDIKLAMYQGDFKFLEKRVAVLEKSISDSPEKALSIPLLRRDQESMNKVMEASRQAVDAQLARIYDQQKWMLTGIGTALLAALTALGGALYKMFSRSPD